MTHGELQQKLRATLSLHVGDEMARYILAKIAQGGQSISILASDAHFYALTNSRQGGAIGGGSLPIVRIFDSATGEEQQPIMAYEKSYRDGVRVAVGDINGDGNDDIVTATRSGTGRIRAFDGLTHQRISFDDLNEIQAFTGKNAHGAYVALGDFYGENRL